MKTAQQWLDEYSQSHQHPVNKRIHHVCVPVIMFTLIGILWSVPGMAGLPDIFNPGVIILLLANIYYLKLSVRLGLGMVIVSLIIVGLITTLVSAGAALLQISLVLFLLAWVAQFTGHQIEGKSPAFLKDLQFLLIGPLWVLADLYRKLKIAY